MVDALSSLHRRDQRRKHSDRRSGRAGMVGYLDSATDDEYDRRRAAREDVWKDRRPRRRDRFDHDWE
jgi:hypothetical protein